MNEPLPLADKVKAHTKPRPQPTTIMVRIIEKCGQPLMSLQPYINVLIGLNELIIIESPLPMHRKYPCVFI